MNNNNNRPQLIYFLVSIGIFCGEMCQLIMSISFCSKAKEMSDLANFLRLLNIAVRTDVLLYWRDDREVVQNIFQIEIRPQEVSVKLESIHEI